MSVQIATIAKCHCLLVALPHVEVDLRVMRLPHEINKPGLLLGRVHQLHVATRKLLCARHKNSTHPCAIFRDVEFVTSLCAQFVKNNSLECIKFQLKE